MDVGCVHASPSPTLGLTESGYVWAPGKDAASFFKSGPNSVGHPVYIHGTWTVDSADSTGQFAGLGGSGADTLHAARGHVSGSYSGS